MANPDVFAPPQGQPNTPVTAPLPSPVVVWVVVSIAVYLAWQISVNEAAWGDFMRDNFLLFTTPGGLMRPWTFLTSAFSHRDPMHLLINLYVMWIFGRPVEMVMGRGTTALLMLLGAFAGSVASWALTLVSGEPIAGLGASAVVQTLAVLFAAAFPQVTLYLLGIVPMPAAVAALLFVGWDVGGVLLNSDDGIGHAAHLGGALVGLLAIPLLWRRIAVLRQAARDSGS